MFVERFGKKTPCDTCPKPLLLPANEWMWEVFQSLSTQAHVQGLGTFTGFDYSSLEFILRAKDVPQCLWGYVLEKVELLTEVAKKYWNKATE